MVEVHLQKRFLFFLAATIAATVLISSAAHSEEKSETIKKLKTLDEIVKNLPRLNVSGKVVDKLGNPIPDADVWLYYARGQNGLRDRITGHVKTGSDGTFLFKESMVWEPKTEQGTSHIPHYIVIARQPDHGIYFTNIFEDDPADKVEIAIRQNTFGEDSSKTRTITVTDDKGNPIPDVKVYLNGGRLLEKDREKLDRKYHYMILSQDIGMISGTTNEQGVITLELVSGAYYMAEKEGYIKTWIPGDKAIMFSGAQVSGTVRYPDGKPAAGAAVTYQYHGNRLVWDETTVTDGEGKYIFKNVPASGFYYSWMNPEDEAGAEGSGGVVAGDLHIDSPYLAKKETFKIQPGDKLEKDITFQEAVKLAGTVIDLATNKPVPKMQMRMLTETGQRYLDSKIVATDENGHFETSVAPQSNVRFSWEESRTDGDYLIDEQWQRQGNNYQPPFRKTVTENEEDLLFKVKLVPIKPFSGRVVDPNGNGLENATVHFHSDLPQAKSDQAGAFELKAVFAEQDFDLYAESKDSSLAGLTHFDAGTDTAILTLSPTKTFEGQVTNTEGLPAGNLKFYLDLKINDDTHYRVRREPTTDQEGKFTVENLYPKALMYAWWSSDNEDNRDYDYGNAEIDLAKLKPGEPIKFEAKQYLNTLMGKVVDEQGNPIARAAIRIRSYDMIQQSERNKQITSDENGEFEIEHLAPGQVELIITAEGYLIKHLNAPTDSFDFEAVLRKDTGHRTINIKVVNDEDKPLADVPVQFQISKRQEDSREIQQETLNARTDAEGKTQFELEPEVTKRVVGRAIVECNLEDYDLAYFGVNLNEESDVVLKVHEPDQHWQVQVLDSETGKPIPRTTAHVQGMQIENSNNYAYFSDDNAYIFNGDDQGMITFDRFSRKDRINVDILAPGYAKEQRWLSSERAENTVFNLNRAGKITGKLVRTDGDQLPEGFRISMVSTPDRRIRENLTVEKDSSFEWDHCAPGTYTLTPNAMTEEAYKFICTSTTCEAEVKTGQTVNIVIEMEEGTLVSGTMIDAATGKPPSDRNYAYVRITEARAYSSIKEDGSWKLYVPEGEYKIMYRCNRTSRQEEFMQVKVEKGKPVIDLVIKVDEADQQSTGNEVGSMRSTTGRSSR